MKSAFLLTGLLAIAGCTQTTTVSTTTGDFRNSHISGNAEVHSGDQRPTVSNAVTVALPLGDSAVKSLFPNGLKNVSASDVAAAKEGVEDKVSEAAQPSVDAKLDQCAAAISSGVTCNIKAQ